MSATTQAKEKVTAPSPTSPKAFSISLREAIETSRPALYHAAVSAVSIHISLRNLSYSHLAGSDLVQLAGFRVMTPTTLSIALNLSTLFCICALSKTLSDSAEAQMSEVISEALTAKAMFSITGAFVFAAVISLAIGGPSGWIALCAATVYSWFTTWLNWPQGSDD